MKPPPPGAPVDVVSVIMVPAETGLAAVVLQDDPSAAAVVQLAITLPAVQMLEVLLGVTLLSCQVIMLPAYE